MMQLSEALVLALVLTSGVLLLAVATVWRCVFSESPSLPMWRFLRRNGIARDDAVEALSGSRVMQAELSCTLCDGGRQCLERLAAGATVPLEHCPNARFFDKFGLRLQAESAASRNPQRPKPNLDFTDAGRSKGPKPAR